MSDPRRSIPRTDALLRESRLAAATHALGPAAVKDAVRAAQQRARDGRIGPQEVADAAVAGPGEPGAGDRDQPRGDGRDRRRLPHAGAAGRRRGEIREVGTTNRTTLADHAAALGPAIGFFLKVHPSNFAITGFTAAASIGLATLGAPVIVQIGSGLRPHPALPAEPDATGALRTGATVVTASGDKLLGGSQAGWILGERPVVDRLSRPAARAVRVDKLTLAALEAALRGPAPPIALVLAADPDRLRERAERLAGELRQRQVEVQVVPSTAAVGGGGAPGVELPSFALRLPERWLTMLRAGDPAVVGRVEGGRCLLDLRKVDPAVDEDLLGAVLACTS